MTWKSLQICKLLETILQQSYFTFQDQIYQHAKGIAMGSPISRTIAEIFLQYLEHIHIKPLLDSKWIVLYSRYIDDILSIFDNERTNPNTLVQYAIHECLQFHPIQESNDRINFLDLTIIRETSHLEIDIYRKPATKDTTIHFLSNHPYEHKLAAYRYYIKRKLNLPLNAERQHREWLTILRIA